MCTATWMRTADGYHVFFNRDERPSRRPATPPAVREVGGARFVAPLDGDYGGTWLAANEFGLTLFLHNGYAPLDETRTEPPGGFTSRGLLVAALAAARSPAGAFRRLRRQDPIRFRTFLLVAFDAAGRSAAVRWDGDSLDECDAPSDPALLVSSSFRRAEVRAAREALFARTVVGAGDSLAAHLAFHRSHLPERGPYSPCMHRPDASTVSFAWVEVTTAAVRMRYAPGPPCATALPDAPVELPRRSAGARSPA